MENKVKGKQGFASMDPKKVKEIAQRGGISAHKLGKAHEFNSETGKAAGSKRKKKNV